MGAYPGLCPVHPSLGNDSEPRPKSADGVVHSTAEHGLVVLGTPWVGPYGQQSPHCATLGIAHSKRDNDRRSACTNVHRLLYRDHHDRLVIGRKGWNCYDWALHPERIGDGLCRDARPFALTGRCGLPANKELEAFSYSVSHDLRAPLRAMDGFSRILLEDYAPQLPPEAQRHLRIIRENANQMGRLINDLLAFSRLSRQPLNKRSIATADLVRQVIESLSSEPAGRQMEISVGELPPCQGDPALLRQVWINLLSNALRFTRQREAARIEIGCVEKEGEPVYFVKDNGAGFDMRYANKLFGVFQRLHSSED